MSSIKYHPELPKSDAYGSPTTIAMDDWVYTGIDGSIHIDSNNSDASVGLQVMDPVLRKTYFIEIVADFLDGIPLKASGWAHFYRGWVFKIDYKRPGQVGLPSHIFISDEIGKGRSSLYPIAFYTKREWRAAFDAKRGKRKVVTTPFEPSEVSGDAPDESASAY